MPQPGDQFGHYRLARLLGQGGMGVVFEAEDLENGRRVALKILSQALDSPEARKRFLREGQIAASINHPNSVYVFGTEEIAGTPVIAMELVGGGTLRDRVAAPVRYRPAKRLMPSCRLSPDWKPPSKRACCTVILSRQIVL